MSRGCYREEKKQVWGRSCTKIAGVLGWGRTGICRSRSAGLFFQINEIQVDGREDSKQSWLCGQSSTGWTKEINLAWPWWGRKATWESINPSTIYLPSVFRSFVTRQVSLFDIFIFALSFSLIFRYRLPFHLSTTPTPDMLYNMRPSKVLSRYYGTFFLCPAFIRVRISLICLTGQELWLDHAFYSLSGPS